MQLQSLVLIWAGAMFFIAVATIFWHFRISRATPRLIVVLGLALAQFASFLIQMLGQTQSVWRLAAAQAGLMCSNALFGWAISSSRRARLAIVFDPAQPQKLLRRGVFSYVRHPFYLSYFFFWLGTSLAAWHWTTASLSAALVAMLALAARDEEQRFETSALADEYRAYKAATGMFLPRIRF